MTHTPLPWGGGKYSSVVGVGITASGSGKVICKFPTITPNSIDPKLPGDAAFNRESIANAEFIVKAVNAFYPLVEALKEADLALEYVTEERIVKKVSTGSQIVRARVKVVKALSLAKGEKV